MKLRLWREVALTHVATRKGILCARSRDHPSSDHPLGLRLVTEPPARVGKTRLLWSSENVPISPLPLQRSAMSIEHAMPKVPRSR